MGKLTTLRALEREVYDGADSAIARLRNNGVPVDTEAKEVVIRNQKPPGIKLWGAIDYLQRFHRYSWVRGR